MVDSNTQKAIDDAIEKANISKNSLGSFIATALEERVGDPLWRSFVVIFLIHNWKAVGALILGDVDDPMVRVSHAKYYLDSSTFLTLNMCGQEYWLVPLGFSFFLIYVYMKFIKPKIVNKFRENNKLCDEMEQIKKDKNLNEINRLNNVIDKNAIECNKDITLYNEYLRYLGKVKDKDYHINYPQNIDKFDVNKTRIGEEFVWVDKKYKLISMTIDKDKILYEKIEDKENKQ